MMPSFFVLSSTGWLKEVLTCFSKDILDKTVYNPNYPNIASISLTKEVRTRFGKDVLNVTSVDIRERFFVYFADFYLYLTHSLVLPSID